MLKNVAHAKYEQILVPDCQTVDRRRTGRKRFFQSVLQPHPGSRDRPRPGSGKDYDREGRQGRVETSVNAELRELYPVIEEAKADTLGMYLNYMLIDKEGCTPRNSCRMSTLRSSAGSSARVRFGAVRSPRQGERDPVQLPGRKGSDCARR